MAMEVDDNENVVTFSQKSLFHLFSKVDQARKKGTSSTTQDYYNAINAELQESNSLQANSNEIINVSLRHYQKMKKSKRMSLGQICESASDDTVLSIDVEIECLPPPPPPAKKSRGPQVIKLNPISKCYKSFNELLERQKRNITKPIIDMMETFIDINGFDLDISQLLDYLVCRQNAKKKDLVQHLPKESTNTKFKATFDDIEAVALMHSLALSKEQMRRVRQFLGAKQVDFPPTNNLSCFRKSLHLVFKQIMLRRTRRTFEKMIRFSWTLTKPNLWI